MNYHDKKFKPIENSSNGEVSPDMVFHYQQNGEVLTCQYKGANIVKGEIIGLVDETGVIEMQYEQINNKGEVRTGKCTSTPETLPSGKIRLHEKWQWTSGDYSHGQSIIEEV
ncbi:n-acetylglutamate synthase [Roseivirga pacifica]|uniref:n-acetylglutamate synthase n=1 Tax=Roseivirga pacifica TaxID=1267423 RepID=UPI00227A6716|nr:n-acetylglutamate synthase [Roseivirga pacifica]